MRGFILNTQLVREEDLLVRILTKDEVVTLYRFYGARHSYINVGYHIDFNIEVSPKVTIKRLRNVVQLSYKFMFDREKVLIYNQFIKLLHKHLIDVSRIDSFYYELLEDISKKLDSRDAKRLIIESYVKLLEKEGRLHKELECFLCEKKIDNEVALARAFLPAHTKCVYSKGFDKEKILTLFNEKKSLLFDDNEINQLYKILLLGI
jgi:recombinational DNA repair protein (RecF pathway)